MWCLTLDQSAKFKKALLDRKIDPAELAGMTSVARRNLFNKFVGEENARQINALFEGKLLLKNQKAGYISWAKKIVGISPKVRQDLISRIERMDRVLDPKEGEQFLQDLASARLRIEVTQDEAKVIADMSKKNQGLKEKANKEGVFPSETDRMAYGVSQVALEKYINDLKLKTKPFNIIIESPGIFKSLVASLDNSFFGRQGIKVLYNKPSVWMRNFIKSWGDIGKELKGKDAMDLIKADIYSRPNALNGKYKVGGYQLDVLSEEAYPSSLPEKIPLLGRLFKASESAYNGAALRMRADLADNFISVAEKNGINTLVKEEAQGIGHLVGSMTGRGSIGWLTPSGQKGVNVLLFSIKFMKSNVETLTAHQFDLKATPFVKKQARLVLTRIIATVATALTIAKFIDPDSVDEDPRSTNFGKIKLFGHFVDITGGMASLATLASRIIPTIHNGEWGLWKKSSTGNWTNMIAGQYGQEDAWDLVVNGLFSNKLSPIAGVVRDALRGEMFGGETFNFKNAVSNLITPLSIQNYQDMKDDPDSSFILGSVIVEGLGFSTSTYRYKANWEMSTSKEMKQFKENVGTDKFKQANDDFNRAYSNWYSIATQSPEYKRLSEDGKGSLITKAKEDIKKQIFEEYEFEYEAKEKTEREEEEIEVIKKLRPE